MYELHAPNEPVRRPGEDVDEHLSDGALTRAAGGPTPRSWCRRGAESANLRDIRARTNPRLNVLEATTTVLVCEL